MTQTDFQKTFSKNFQEAFAGLKKTGILLWTNSKPKNTFILKKDGKRYLGLPRKDKNGDDYWKFKEIEDKSSLESSPVMDKVDKFNQRQEKVKGYENNSK